MMEDNNVNVMPDAAEAGATQAYTRISYTKKVTLTSPEFVQSCPEYLHQERLASPDDVNGRMDPQYAEVNYAEGTMTVRFQVKEWELNRVGILHGGITSTMLDHTAGSVVYAFTGHFCPSLDIVIKFISQAVLGDTLTCIGRVIHCGERFVTAEAVLTNDTSGRLVATGIMTYANGADRAKGAVDKGTR